MGQTTVKPEVEVIPPSKIINQLRQNPEAFGSLFVKMLAQVAFQLGESLVVMRANGRINCARRAPSDITASDFRLAKVVPCSDAYRGLIANGLYPSIFIERDNFPVLEGEVLVETNKGIFLISNPYRSAAEITHGREIHEGKLAYA